MRIPFIFILLLTSTDALGMGESAPYILPLAVGPFPIQSHTAYTTEDGLPPGEIRAMRIDSKGRVVAVAADGEAVWQDGRWRLQESAPHSDIEAAGLDPEQIEELHSLAGKAVEIRAVAEHQGETAVAAQSGLYLGKDSKWSLALPQEGPVRWAPVDVRAVVYDLEGRLWFASPQGVGVRHSDHDWDLFTGAEGLPYNDFTCMAAGPSGVWFGTSNGAIHYRDGLWSFRQGGRWLIDDHVSSIVVDGDGAAWIATGAGVSRISERTMTLTQKADFYREEIELRHRRTEFGYVNPADLAAPGDLETAVPTFTDNDGHNTGMYLAAVSLGYAATGDPQLREDAHKAFRALAFLSEVTQGGTHPAPEGFIARAVRPTSEPDPNPQFNLEYDLRRKKADSLWKIIQPRWPIDESGNWYWKNDSSSDELDGHFLGYGVYYDRVCRTDEEKEAVRTVVRRIMDHILRHGYNLVDYDGLPTRWGHFSPDDLNRNEDWCTERGLNSLSILTYLTITHHITDDPKYREALLELALDHGYGMNGMTQPKSLPGPDSAGHQPDDNMAFMNYYHLLRYETDPKLLSMFQHAIFTHWQYEKRERNPFTNFIYAACCLGKVRTDPWGDIDLSPPESCFADAVDTLKRYPLDLLDWPMSNAHRIDLTIHLDEWGRPSGSGGRHDGQVYPIDERHEVYWDWNPWVLTYGGKGTRLRPGFHYLLAYYMGLAHGFITD